MDSLGEINVPYGLGEPESILVRNDCCPDDNSFRYKLFISVLKKAGTLSGGVHHSLSALCWDSCQTHRDSRQIR